MRNDNRLKLYLTHSIINKINMITSLLFCTFLLSIISCSKLKLNNTEQQLFDVYNIEDTLIFQSLQTGKIRHFKIIDKRNYNPPVFATFSEGSGTDRSRDAIIRYLDLDNGSNPSILDIQNRRKSEIISSNFEGFQGVFSTSALDSERTKSTDTLNYLGKKIINYYMFSDNNSTILIWQKKYGIVMYIHAGEKFVRTNIPNIIK